MAAKQAALASKDEELLKAHEDLKQRLTLLQRVQDLEMENADFKQSMEKVNQAQVGLAVGWFGLVGLG
jgi:hypothetical protein